MSEESPERHAEMTSVGATFGSLVYLVDVGMPHLGEEAEGGRGVRVVHGKRDVSLRWNQTIGVQFTFNSKLLMPQRFFIFIFTSAPMFSDHLLLTCVSQ